MLSTQDRATIKSKVESYPKDQKILLTRDRVTVNSEAGLWPKYQKMMSNQDPLAWEAELRPYSKFEELMELPPWNVTTMTMESEAGDEEKEDIATTR